MKKIVILILLLAAVGGIIYVMQNKKSDSALREEGIGEVMESMPEPPPVSPIDPPAPTPTPPPADPDGGPIKDDMGDVDVAPAKVFNITGKNFSFSQTEIKVKNGDRVLINFESTDGFHDWVVDEFKANTERVNPGTKTSVEFIADKTGTFEYYCSVSIHRAAGMKGKLIVE